MSEPVIEEIDFDSLTEFDTATHHDALTARQLLERLWALMINDPDVADMRVRLGEGRLLEAVELAADRESPNSDDDYVVVLR